MEPQDELATRSDQKVEIIGVELTVGEGFETIEDHRFCQLKFFQSAGVEDQGLTGEPDVTVGQEPGGDPEGSTGLADTGTTNQKVQNVSVVDGTMGPIVDIESPTGKAVAADSALEPRDWANNLGITESTAEEPG